MALAASPMARSRGWRGRLSAVAPGDDRPPKVAAPRVPRNGGVRPLRAPGILGEPRCDRGAAGRGGGRTDGAELLLRRPAISGPVLAAPQLGEPPGNSAQSALLESLESAQGLSALGRVVLDGFVALFSAHACPPLSARLNRAGRSGCGNPGHSDRPSPCAGGGLPLPTRPAEIRNRAGFVLPSVVQDTRCLVALTGAVLGGDFSKLPRTLPRAVRTATRSQVKSRPA